MSMVPHGPILQPRRGSVTDQTAPGLRLPAVGDGCGMGRNCPRPATRHELPRCIATHFLQNGTDLRTGQELIRHRDASTPMICRPLMTRPGIGAPGRLDVRAEGARNSWRKPVVRQCPRARVCASAHARLARDVLVDRSYIRGSPCPLTAIVAPGGTLSCARCSRPRKTYVTSQYVGCPDPGIDEHLCTSCV